MLPPRVIVKIVDFAQKKEVAEVDVNSYYTLHNVREVIKSKGQLQTNFTFVNQEGLPLAEDTHTVQNSIIDGHMLYIKQVKDEHKQEEKSIKKGTQKYTLHHLVYFAANSGVYLGRDSVFNSFPRSTSAFSQRTLVSTKMWFYQNSGYVCCHKVVLSHKT